MTVIEYGTTQRRSEGQTMANHEQDYCYDFSGHYAYILVSGKKSLIFEIVAEL